MVFRHLHNVHTLAILKGAVEGDDTRHLAALSAFGTHVAPLVSAGFVTEFTDGSYVATDAGLAFYTQYRLAQLPDGRANAWSSDGEVGHILTTASDALDALK